MATEWKYTRYVCNKLYWAWISKVLNRLAEYENLIVSDNSERPKTVISAYSTTLKSKERGLIQPKSSVNVPTTCFQMNHITLH